MSANLPLKRNSNLMSRLTKRHLMVFILSVIIFITPIRNAPIVVLGRFTPIVLISIFLVIWFGTKINNANKIHVSRFNIYCCILSVWAIVSTFWSVNPGASIRESIYLFGYTVLTIGTFDVLHNSDDKKKVVYSYASVCTLLSILVLYNYFTGQYWSPNRYSAFGMNPNRVGFYFVLGIPLIIQIRSDRSRNKNTFSKVIFFAYIILTTVAILATGSRGAIVAAVPSLTLLAYLFYTNKEVRSINKYLTTAGLLLILVYALLGSGITDRIFSIYTEIRTLSIGNRFVIWAEGFDLWLQQPVTGVGFAAFEAAVEPALGPGSPPESTILGLLYQLGLVGIIIALIALKSISSKLLTDEVAFAFGSTIFLLFTVNDWLEYPTLWILSGVFLSVIYTE